MGFQHCADNDLDGMDSNFIGHCDYFSTDRKLMHRGNWLTLVFLSLAFVLPLCQDIHETVVEEAILDHHLESTVNMPAELLRIALRVRRFIKPWFITCVVAVLLVMDPLTAKNITLNILAVAMFSEVDRVVAALLLKESQTLKMEKLVKDASGSDLNSIARLSFFWTRLQGCLSVIFLIMFIYFLEELIESCGNLTLYVFIYFLSFAPLVVPLLQGIGQMVSSIKNSERNSNVMFYATDLLQNFVIIMLFHILSDFAS